MTKAPERIWAKQTSGWGDLRRGVCQNRPADGFKAFIPEDLSDALIGAAYEEAAAEALKAMSGYCHPLGKGDRYALGVQAGAVKARDRIRALTPADARAALERVEHPRWYRMDDPENPPPEPEVYHMRGLWWEGQFVADLGRVHQTTGEFVDRYSDDLSFAVDQYTHWTPLIAPPEDEG